MKAKMIKVWIEAMRLRTLPVSVAGVFVAWAFAILAGRMRWAPALLCLAFAVLAQIASNFANEYYDFRDGLDRPGREGPRRGVTEGDVSPRAMLTATFATLAAACCVGLSLVAWGGWWLIAAGIVIALGVVAYSAGPWPLSRHGLGEIAVVFFFGIIPVCLGFYVISGIRWADEVGLASVATGLMGANVLIVNNYRDRDADALVGKRTLAVRFGHSAMSALYLINGYMAVALCVTVWAAMPLAALIVPLAYIAIHTILYWRITARRGRALNPYLGITAILMLSYWLAFLLLAGISRAFASA